MRPIAILAILTAAASVASTPAVAAGRPLTVADLLAFQRISEPQLSPDGLRAVYTVAVPDISANRLARNVWIVSLADGRPRALTTTGRDGGAKWSPDGRRLAFVSSRDGSALTQHNDALLSSLDLAKAESFTFAGAGGTEVQGFLVRPPAFDASKKYPVVMLLHGGPQTQWSDTWSYRWNAQAFAAAGYVVVMINRRGSTGFGQTFTDEIALDWGGKPFEDLMKGLEFVAARYPFADGQRVAAAGGSYGGYMANWLASHARGRFKALISHAGVYNLTSMYGSTEELWFPERDFGGTPWKRDGTANKAYETLSPHTYAAEFGQYKTPTLVIAGEQDYRVPYAQSLEFFTALQRQDVPSQLVLFPDEGHWILKPQNSRVWYGEVLGWLRKFI